MFSGLTTSDKKRERPRAPRHWCANARGGGSWRESSNISITVPSMLAYLEQSHRSKGWKRFGPCFYFYSTGVNFDLDFLSLVLLKVYFKIYLKTYKIRFIHL